MTYRRQHLIRTLAAVALFGSMPAVANAGSQINVALTADGATFVAASSHDVAAAGLSLEAMEDNLLTNTPVRWLPPQLGSPTGDKRYIFGSGDTDQWVEISLGHATDIDAVGASVDLPYSDRYVTGPFTVEVSTNGVDWTNWASGAEITPTKHSTNPLVIMGPAESVEYIKYFFGPTAEYPNRQHPVYSGSGIHELFAYTATPEPSSWALMATGVAALGALVRRRRHAITLPG